MVWKKDQFYIGSSSVDKYFEEILVGPVEVVNNLVCICLLLIIVSFIRQTTYDMLCVDGMSGLFSNI